MSLTGSEPDTFQLWLYLLQVLVTNLTRRHVYEIRVEGVTRSRMTRGRIYRGELSAPVKVSDLCQPVLTSSDLSLTSRQQTER